MLLGCESVAVKLQGSYKPHGTAAMSYLKAGSPVIIGNLGHTTNYEMLQFVSMVEKFFEVPKKKKNCSKRVLTQITSPQLAHL